MRKKKYNQDSDAEKIRSNQFLIPPKQNGQSYFSTQLHLDRLAHSRMHHRKYPPATHPTGLHKCAQHQNSRSHI